MNKTNGKKIHSTLLMLVSRRRSIQNIRKVFGKDTGGRKLLFSQETTGKESRRERYKEVVQRCLCGECKINYHKM